MQALPLPFFQIRHRAGHAAVHQQAALARAGFAHGGDADGSLVGDGTFVFANAAADAQCRVHVRPAQRDGIAVALRIEDNPRSEKDRQAIFSGPLKIPCAASTRARMRCASALRWPWLASGSVPPLDSIRMSDQMMPVLMWTDATLLMLMLISSLLNHERLWRMTAWSVTSMTVRNR